MRMSRNRCKGKYEDGEITTPTNVKDIQIDYNIDKYVHLHHTTHMHTHMHMNMHMNMHMHINMHNTPIKCIYCILP